MCDDVLGRSDAVPEYEIDRRTDDDTFGARTWPHLLGKCAAVIDEIKPAAQIMDEMVSEAIEVLQSSSKLIVSSARL